MSFLNHNVVSPTALVRQAQRYVHCQFMALPSNLTHKQMFSIAATMETIDSEMNLETLLKFSNELTALNLDQAALALELSLTDGLQNFRWN